MMTDRPWNQPPWRSLPRQVHIWGKIMTPIEIVIVLTCMACFGLWLGAADRA